MEVRQRRIQRYGTVVEGPPADPDVSYPTDDDHSFFTPGRDFESIYTNHKYTSDERQTLASYESLDYLPSHSSVYCKWLERQPRRLDWDRWLMMGLIGFCVGIVGFLLHQLIDVISEVKWDKAQEILHETGLVATWGFVLGYSLLFVAVASALILIRPSAAGSGIPELIGFLNGTMVRHIFNIKTLTAKFFSCCCAVGGGMPIGPEGPMIHMGSLIGAGVSQFKSDTLNFRLPFFERFRNSEDRRNFVSAGAAAGVAAAFGAPVGGLLFSMEEVSSFWNMKLSWQTFFCCMVSTFTNDLFNSAFYKFQYRGDFGLFKLENYILFQVHKGIPVNILVFLPTIVLGFVCGLLGALFTIVNLKLARLRRRLLARLGRRSRWGQRIVRFLEPLVVIALFASLSVTLPSAFPCSSFTCGRMQNGTERRSPNCLTDVQNPVHVEPSVVQYLCPPGVARRGSNGVTWTNETYNEAATILFLTGERAIRHLFSRNTHFEFGYAALVVVLIVYFFFACWAAGTAISSGLVVPMLMIGGLCGRLIGLAMVDLFGLHAGSRIDQYWAWIDPGAFALIGAASFFGGVSRLTMSLTVIMMEITNDVQFLLPIMVGIMVAKWAGDLITHPLYHSLLELKCIPFLDSEPVVMHKKKALNLELYSVSHIMSSPVTTLRVREKVSVIADLLLTGTHSGFPVVAPHFNTGGLIGEAVTDNEIPDRLLGTITRLELIVLLKAEHRFSPIDQVDPNAEDEIDPTIDYFTMTLDKLDKPDIISEHLESLASDPRYAQQWLDLRPFVNRSAVSVREDFSLHRAYILVRSLGLRHLVVTDHGNRVCGIVTRKDLMGFRLEERLEPLLRREIEFSENIGFSNSSA